MDLSAQTAWLLVPLKMEDDGNNGKRDLISGYCGLSTWVSYLSIISLPLYPSSVCILNDLETALMKHMCKHM